MAKTTHPSPGDDLTRVEHQLTLFDIPALTVVVTSKDISWMKRTIKIGSPQLSFKRLTVHLLLYRYPVFETNCYLRIFPDSDLCCLHCLSPQYSFLSKHYHLLNKIFSILRTFIECYLLLNYSDQNPISSHLSF